ncbi:7-cyano-7-deazaguanine synthase QueC [Helicobacter mustelae]|uniref:7-cyano-7-deazaguanine synthase n=1 Tax=Helicobacter mustelae (strain ATCC 43772 / CCUG 25715 / CIP 103759 / LMG 18044 / NCTC 12198 / R85-136P) TaxID=679897 RepID=D3UGG7_HELM1|nr:7-cyano-7-deazaguanine synthase QueC [Helicobacter mustelae]CBG39588.1 Putative queuosine biosynthesis protein [Helicobacter mustelae 12198]SQH71100.1 queuosine biosynthesis protein [Helicobacter mustelae]STP12229.1 queuosine biosynthesis protein [Helicobacter mustelae]
MQKCLVVFSGGQDSTTVAAWAKKEFSSVELLAFDYQQKHRIELQQARKIAEKLELKLNMIVLDFLAQIADSALFAKSIENLSTKHKTHQDLLASFVPNRNGLFLTIAHAFAQKIHANHIAIGVSEQDYSGYPDCREEFITAMESALNKGAQTQIKIHTPLSHMSKAEEFLLAQNLGVLEMILEDSHTCYEGVRESRHAWGYGCGICAACILRKNAYEKFLAIIAQKNAGNG